MIGRPGFSVILSSAILFNRLLAFPSRPAAKPMDRPASRRASHNKEFIVFSVLSLPAIVLSLSKYEGG